MKHIKTLEVYIDSLVNEGLRQWLSGLYDKVEYVLGNRLNEVIQYVASTAKSIGSFALSVIKGIGTAVMALLGLAGFGLAAIGPFMGIIGGIVIEDSAAFSGGWFIAAGLIVWGIIGVILYISAMIADDGKKWHQRPSGVSDAEAHSSSYIARHSGYHD